MTVLRLTSCMAPNMDGLAAGLAGWLSREPDLTVEFVDAPSWQARERRFDAGEVDIIWICGLPYVWRADMPAPAVELLAAPVMAAERYGDRPIYFSDVVVRRQSGIQGFGQLQGKRWSYNEPHSHSGYNVVRAKLAAMGEDWAYFGQVVAAGSHQRSLAMILEGEVDGSAIDSTVLEVELKRDPALTERIRVIEVLGPSPIPPLVIRRTVAPAQRRRLRQLLIGMADSEDGRRRLAALGLRRLAAVEDGDYDPIRRMDRQAAAVPPPIEA